KRKTPSRCNGTNASDKLAPRPRRSSARAGEGADAAGYGASDRLGPDEGPTLRGPSVTRGQKRVEDARRRAYDPRVHPLRKNFFANRMDCRVKPGNAARCELVASISTESSQGDSPSPMLLRVMAAE